MLLDFIIVGTWLIGTIGYLFMLTIINNKALIETIVDYHLCKAMDKHTEFASFKEWHQVGRNTVEDITRALDCLLWVLLGLFALHCIGTTLYFAVYGQLSQPYFDTYVMLVLLVLGLNVMTLGSLGTCVSYLPDTLDSGDMKDYYPLKIRFKSDRHLPWVKLISVILLILGQIVMFKSVQG